MRNITNKNYGVTELQNSELLNITGGGIYELFKGIGGACRNAVDSVIDAFLSMGSADHTKYGGTYLESISGRSSII